MPTLREFISSALSETKDVPPSDIVDTMMFKVAFKPADKINKDEFIKISKSIEGEFNKVDVFDGQEHGYMELGGWIGDQRDALIFMALGAHLGVFELRTPASMLSQLSETEEGRATQRQMAGMGMISIVEKKPMMSQAHGG